MLENAFDEYVSHYDMLDKDIKLKYNHSYRVRDLQEKYAKLLNWNKENIELAKIIGMLHDIGRFEQLRVYHTYDDTKSIDHADYSVKQLFDKGEIKKFCPNEKWYQTIKFAIKNHNKYQIEDCNDENMIKHAKLIRDTDKIDILYLMGTLKETGKVIDDSKISKQVKNMILKRLTVPKESMKTKNDRFVNKLAFAYDMYYDCTLNELQDNMKAFYNDLKDNNELLEIYNEVNKYIDERTNKNGRTR